MLGFLIDINHNIEHKKWWKMVPISSLNSRIFEKKKRVRKLCVGVRVWGHHGTNFWHVFLDSLLNFTSFDTKHGVGEDWGRPPTREKLVKNTILRGLKLRGLTWNQMNTPYSIYEIDQRKKLNTLSDFENQKPTHIDATHAFSKTLKNFQNRIPRELNQNLYIFRIGINHWISSNFLN